MVDTGNQVWVRDRIEQSLRDKNPIALIQEYQTYSLCLHDMSCTYEMMESLHEELLEAHPSLPLGQERSIPPVMVAVIEDVVENLINRAVLPLEGTHNPDDVAVASTLEKNTLGHRDLQVSENIHEASLAGAEASRLSQRKSSSDAVFETFFGSTDKFLQADANDRVKLMKSAAVKMERYVKKMFTLELVAKHRIIQCKLDQFNIWHRKFSKNTYSLLKSIGPRWPAFKSQLLNLMDVAVDKTKEAVDFASTLVLDKSLRCTAWDAQFLSASLFVCHMFAFRVFKR